VLSRNRAEIGGVSRHLDASIIAVSRLNGKRHKQQKPALPKEKRASVTKPKPGGKGLRNREWVLSPRLNRLCLEFPNALQPFTPKSRSYE
jgi:hypothetical protein